MKIDFEVTQMLMASVRVNLPRFLVDMIAMGAEGAN